MIQIKMRTRHSLKQPTFKLPVLLSLKQKEQIHWMRRKILDSLVWKFMIFLDLISHIFFHVLYSYSSTVLKDALMRFQLQNEIEKININYKKRGKKKFIYEFNRDTIIMIMMVVESHCSQSNISFPFYISYRTCNADGW